MSAPIGDYDEGFQGSSSPRDLETLCQLVYLYATGPRRDPDAFASWLARTRTWFQNRESDPMSALRDTVQVRATCGDPRSRPLTRRTSRRATSTRRSPSTATCSPIAATSSSSSSATSIRPRSSRWPGPGSATCRDAGARTTGSTARLRCRSGRSTRRWSAGLDPKGYVQFVFQGEAPWSPELAYALESTVAALRIRLRQVVREEKSGTYGVRLRGRFGACPRDRYRLDLGWGCDPARADELTAAVWRVIDEMRTQGPDDGDAHQGPRDPAAGERDRPAGQSLLAAPARASLKDGTDPHRILRRADDVATLSPDLIQDCVARYLERDGLREGGAPAGRGRPVATGAG